MHLNCKGKALSSLVESLREYDSIEFVKTTQALKRMVSQNFMQILSDNETLKTNLKILRDVFLLFRADFFCLFAEELSPIMSKSPDKFSEDQVNRKIYSNTLMRLNIPSEHKIFGAVKFLLKSKGFAYKNFKDTRNLRLCGDVEQKFSNMRLKSARNCLAETVSGVNHSSIWNLVKQNVQQGFELLVAFRFKRNMTASSRTALEGDSLKPSSNCFSLKICLQSSCDVKSSKQALSVTSTNTLESAVFLEVGFRQNVEAYSNGNQGFKVAKSYVSVSFKNERVKDEHPISVTQMTGEQIDFADQDIVFMRIVNTTKKLLFQISNDDLFKIKASEIRSTLEIPVELSNYINLQK